MPNNEKQKIKLRLPKGEALFSSQRKHVKFFIRNGGGYDQSDPGTGKSIVAAVWAAHIDAKKLLIVGPAIMRDTIADEMAYWSRRKPRWKIEVIDKNTVPDKYGRKLPSPDTTCLIVSYRYIIEKRLLKPLLRVYDFDAVIFDEWHYCKDLKAKRTKYALYLERQAKYTLCLSGTPYINNATELYSQLIPFAPEKHIGKNVHEFGAKFSNLVDTGFGQEYRGVRNTKRLKKIMRKFSRRRSIEEVLPDLPPLTIKQISLDIPKSLAKKSLKYVDAVVEKITGQTEYIDPEIADYVSTVRKQLGLSKCRGIVEYALYQLEQRENFVLYAYHNDTIEVIKQTLREKGVSCRAIWGKTSGPNKQKFIKGFQAKKFQVLILQIRSAIGITLTSTNYGICAELDYSWAAMEQAFKRIHRITQKDSVQIDVLNAKNSLDGAMLAALYRKRRDSKRVKI